MQNLYAELEELLKAKPEFTVAGKLNKSKISDAAYRYNEQLLEMLLGHKGLRKQFFKEIAGATVFSAKEFLLFLRNKSFLEDSYTAYKNQIGLQDERGEYYRENNRVALAFPYKDCVLEGGQDKEDQKRDEIFYNETLAPDEITRLFDTKALTNFKLYDAKGEHKLTAKSEIDFSQQNLILKGNNLLALHSLKKMYANKVKLIYIDPPYNTGNDGFNYNDKFNHSTWLVFMKNRLEVANDLLEKNGLLWISISDTEAHYLKILCDEIFNRENFVADVIWNSTKSVTNTAIISDAHTHTLLYSKNINLLKVNRTSFRLPADETKFSNPDNDPRGKWVADPFQVGGERPHQLYEIINPTTGTVYRPNPGSSWKNEKIVFDELLKDNRIVFGVSGEAGPQRKRFWYEAKERGEVTTTLWKDLQTTTNGTQHLKILFGDKVFQNPKPEELIKRIIELSTKEGDIILDYHLGSGTTAAAAHKMNRRYIGIEQLDYVNNVTVERLRKVINNERGGISEEVNWQGGGSFVYAELKRYNQYYIDEIEKAKDTKTLLKLYEQMKEEAFCRIEIEHEKWDNGAFANLTLDEQKQLLCECLDKNHLYVNLTEMEDTYYKMSKDEIALNKKFYNIS